MNSLFLKTFTGVELEPFDPYALGNWASEELSDSQINYAAKNVMAVLDIFCTIYANRLVIIMPTLVDHAVFNAAVNTDYLIRQVISIAVCIKTRI